MWRFLASVSDPKAPTSNKRNRDQDKEYDSSKRKRMFKKEWQIKFKWLEYNENDGVMFCKLCREGKVTGDGKKHNVFYEGTGNFKLDSVRAHDGSENHSLAVARNSARKAVPGTSQAEKMLKSLNSAAVQRLKLLFRNAHAIAYNCRPYTDFRWMARLDRAKGLDVGSVYHSDKSARTFVHYIAEVERSKLKEHLNQTQFISLISDGTTDSSITEAEILYVRYCIDGTTHTQLVGVESVPKADAASITSSIIEGLQKRLEIDEEFLRRKLVGFGSDGASVMVGRNRGVATMMRRYSPCLQAVHCTAHRLELAFKDALKNVNLYSTLSNLLVGLYLFYRNSSKNRSGLKLAADAENQAVYIPTRAGGTRWLPHLTRALQQILRGYKAILTHLQQVEAEPGMSTDAKAKARSYIRSLKRQDLIKFAHFMVDVVGTLSTVSLAAQRENNSVADVAASIESASEVLQKYKSKKITPMLQNFEDGLFQQGPLTGEGDISAAVATVLSRLYTSLEGRFQDMNSGVLSGLRIASFKFWPFDTESLEDFGSEHVSQLVNHFQPVLEEAGVLADHVAVEWDLLKARISAKHKTAPQKIKSCKWAEIIPAMQDELPNICALINLTLTIPASSADAERGFSRMKQLKNKHRTRLLDVTDQLVVMLHSPPIESFDPVPAIDLWNSAGVRSKRRFLEPASRDVVHVDESTMTDQSYSESESSQSEIEAEL